MRHIRKAPLPCAAILMPSACGASTIATTRPASTPTAAPTPPPTPSPTVDPIAAAAQFYVSTANTHNAAEGKVAKEEPAGTLYTKLAVTEKQSVAALMTLQNAIYSYSWPTDVQAQITALTSADEAGISAIQDFIADPGQTTWNADLATGQSATNATAAVRLALHLPPVAQ